MVGRAVLVATLAAALPSQAVFHAPVGAATFGGSSPSPRKKR